MHAHRTRTAGAFGIGEVITPVLDYLNCSYAPAEGNPARVAASDLQGNHLTTLLDVPVYEEHSKLDVDSYQTLTGESLALYRRLLDDWSIHAGC